MSFFLQGHHFPVGIPLFPLRTVRRPRMEAHGLPASRITPRSPGRTAWDWPCSPTPRRQARAWRETLLVAHLLLMAAARCRL